MKRFLGIFATALLFLFLFTFFGGSYFLDIKVEALQKRVDELEAARQKTDEAK